MKLAKENNFHYDLNTYIHDYQSLIDEINIAEKHDYLVFCAIGNFYWKDEYKDNLKKVGYNVSGGYRGDCIIWIISKLSFEERIKRFCVEVSGPLIKL